jgi:hypothetical protein
MLLGSHLEKLRKKLKRDLASIAARCSYEDPKDR